MKPATSRLCYSRRMPRRTRSAIPKSARERITQRFPNGARKSARYIKNGKVVGIRAFFETGEPETEWILHDGIMKDHQDWDAPGILTFHQPFRNGLEHGTARQWNHNGKPLGSFTMKWGCGIDLWRQENEDGSIFLAEVMYYKDGQAHGFDWFIDDNQRTVHIESHYQAGLLHGIRREWNPDGRLKRATPQYWVSGRRVTKRQYLKSSKTDEALPPYRKIDDRPKRIFPPEIAKHLRFPRP